MVTELSITDARKGFSSLYDDVFNLFKPAIVKRKESESVLLVRLDLQKKLLTHFSLKPEIIEEEDGSVTLALDELEIYVNDETLEKAANELIDEIKEYAKEYIERSQLFLNAPNRQHHFPYILRILLCDNDEEIREYLEI